MFWLVLGFLLTGAGIWWMLEFGGKATTQRWLRWRNLSAAAALLAFVGLLCLKQGSDAAGIQPAAAVLGGALLAGAGTAKLRQRRRSALPERYLE